MRGEILLIAFIIGNMALKPLEHRGYPDSFSLILAISILITATYRTEFRLKWKFFTINTAYIIFFLIGMLNGTRTSTRSDSTIESVSATYIKEVLQNTRRRFTERTGEIIDDDQSRAVILALTIGDKEHIASETKVAYQKSGAMHLLALSGLHIGTIYGIMGLLLLFLNFNHASRQLKHLITSFAIIIYAAFTGFGPSVMRAAIMIITHNIVKMSGREGGKWSSLIYSATIILLIFPESISKIGFQLSYCAVAGIIFIYPELEKSLNLNNRFAKKIIKPIWNMLSISVACQIATLPLVWYYFKTAPQYFLITNLFAVPLVSIAIYAFAVAYITYGIPYFGEISTFIAERTIMLLNDIITAISKV